MDELDNLLFSTLSFSLNFVSNQRIHFLGQIFPHHIYNNLIIKCNSKNMLETINYYLKNEDKRIENINLIYNFVTNNLHVNKFLNI